MRRLQALAIGTLALALYLLTLAPSFLWSDSAKLAIFVHEGQLIARGQELHGIHPMHGVLGYLLAFLPLSLAFTQNLLSAIAGAVALFFLHRAITIETDDHIAATLATTALAVSHLFWHYAVINETYSLVALTLAALLYAAASWRRDPRPVWLHLIAFVAGAGFANHSLTLFFLPGILVMISRKELLRFVLSPHLFLALALGIIGAFPMTLMPVAAGIPVATLASELIRSTLYHSDAFAGSPGKLLTELLRYPLYALYQFPVGLPFALFGLVTLVRRDRRALAGTALIWGLVVLFACQYFLQRQFAMMIPSFVLIAFWLGHGIAELRRRESKVISGRRLAALALLLGLVPPIAYATAYRVAEGHVGFIRKLPYRPTARYFLLPPKQMEDGAERYVEDAFRQAKPGALILADFNPGMALVYGQKVLGLRPDLTIEIKVDDWVLRGMDESGINTYLDEVTQFSQATYLADDYEPYYHTSSLEKRFELRREGGPLIEVLPLPDGPPSD